MKTEDLRRLHMLVDAKYKARQQMLLALLERERVIRSDLLKLDDQSRASAQRAGTEMKAIGGDVIWQAWLGKAKMSLNKRLALVLAEKEQHLQRVRAAYGKVLASEELLAELTAERQEQARKIDLGQAVDAALFDPRKND